MSTVTSVAILGGGVVGSELIKLLEQRPEFEVSGVLVREPERQRDFPRWRQLSSSDPAFVARSEVVVELMGGTDRAVELGLAALARGATLVTANKAALAERWDDYLPYLRLGRVHFEAAVMAGTPVVGPVAGALRGSKPVSMHGVFNGTCNVILSAMDEGVDYQEALSEAQRLGFAEADPALDVGGFDAAHKLTVLARLAFDPSLSWSQVRANTRGIEGLNAALLADQRAAGRRVRLVGSVQAGADAWRTAVRPVALPEGHPLLVNGAENVLSFSGDPLGTVVIRGPGAGGGATASGVLADLLNVAAGVSGPLPLSSVAALPTAPPAAGSGVADFKELSQAEEA